MDSFEEEAQKAIQEITSKQKESSAIPETIDEISKKTSVDVKINFIGSKVDESSSFQIKK